MTSPPTLLFSYGTLQNKRVQIANFDREFIGREDVLPGYVLRTGAIADPGIAALTGKARYSNIEPSSNPAAQVRGMVFQLTEEELARADEYERDAEYRRIVVTLRSGDQAWVYLRAAEPERLV